MTPNKILGLVLIGVGVLDMVLMQSIGSRLPEQVRTLVRAGGIGFIVLGALVASGKLTLISG